jgi:hypothetical protein
MSALLIRRSTLGFVKQALTELITHRELINLFERHGLDGPDADDPEISSKLKRANAHLDRKDWTDAIVLKRLTGALEEVLVLKSEPNEESPEYIRKMLAALEEDGLRWTGRTFIGPCSAGLSASANTIRRFGLETVNQEIERGLDNLVHDPSDALTAAKCVVESTCKAVLPPEEAEAAESEDIVQLTKRTLKHLDLLPDGISAKNRGEDAVGKMLKGMATCIQGLTELRNLYGDPHGKPPGWRGVGPPHARCALSLASCLCTFLLETKEARSGSEEHA